MTVQELEEQLAKVDRQLADELNLAAIRGIDYSWRGRTRRCRLKGLHIALGEMIEYQRACRHPYITSFCRKKPQV
jgi:hypothetical protein